VSEIPASDIAVSAPVELKGVTVGYGRDPVSTDLDLAIPPGKLTMVIGPNGCGKSTALRAMARLIAPQAGAVLLEGRDIRELPTSHVARRLGLLPQQSIAPDGIRVAELVARGRHPHQGAFRQWSDADETAVAEAMERTGVAAYSGLPDGSATIAALWRSMGCHTSPGPIHSVRVHTHPRHPGDLPVRRGHALVLVRCERRRRRRLEQGRKV
jgi:ABC-type multidrug transport system fused ATPase/permease subunit